MKKFQFIGLILLILSACSSQPTPLPIPTFTPSPTVQVTISTATAVPSVTAETPAAQTTSIVGTPTACKDSALNTNWTRDDAPYNFTDFGKNRPIPPNGHFSMSWTLQNTGTCTWDSSYEIVFKSGYRMAKSVSYPIVAEGNTVVSGQSTIVNISMVAPQDTGSHQAVWQLQSRDGTPLLKFNVFVKVDKGSYSPPSRPIQLTYKSSCESGFAKIRLSWVDASNNEDGYRIYRNSKMLVELPANTTSVLDAIPGGEGKYNYTVVAFNGSGEGSANAFAEITTCK
jgi:hypothetical protein